MVWPWKGHSISLVALGPPKGAPASPTLVLEPAPPGVLAKGFCWWGRGGGERSERQPSGRWRSCWSLVSLKVPILQRRKLRLGEAEHLSEPSTPNFRSPAQDLHPQLLAELNWKAREWLCSSPAGGPGLSPCPHPPSAVSSSVKRGWPSSPPQRAEQGERRMLDPEPKSRAPRKSADRNL